MTIDPRAKTARKKFGNGIPPVYRIALDWCRNPCPITGWQPKVVLDYGCGYARFADDFIRAGAFYVGTDLHRQDFSDQPLFEAELLREEGWNNRAAFVPSDYLHNCEGYDLVMLSNVCNIQTEYNELERIIKDAFRLIDKGGSVLLNWPKSPRKIAINQDELEEFIYHRVLDRKVGVLKSKVPKTNVIRLIK